MNPQEKTQLQQFLDGLMAAKDVNPIPEADQIIRQAVARQQNAAYLLVQRCMLLTQALEQTKSRLSALEETQNSSRSFLDSGYALPAAARSPAPGTYAPGNYVPSPSPPSAYAPPAGGGGGSFLGQAAATAAGVAGGAFLFEGLEHLFDRHGGFGGEGLASRPEEVTINNYYDESGNSRDGDAPSDEPASQDERFSNADDTPFDDAQFDDSGNDDGESFV